MKVKVPLFDKLHTQICGFHENKKLEYPLLNESYRGIFIFFIEMNGNTNHVFDLVYINGYSITKIINNADGGMKYSIYNKHLIVECAKEWSYGIVISNFL